MSVTACDSSENATPLPKPAPLRARRERDDWLKPGKDVHLQAVSVRPLPNGLRVQNGEPFDLMLMDDVRLSVIAPNADVRTNGPYVPFYKDDGWLLHLRCPAPRIIGKGTDIDILYESCAATTYEPGPGARLLGFHLVAREGFRETNFGAEVPIRLARK